MSPSLQTMGFFMSDINFCNTKEQLNHLGEVITGKVDGSPTGADIDTSTLPYTGQVRKTLPALEGEYEQSITDKEAEADAAIDSYRLLNKGPYASGITLESKFEYITYNGESYFATNPPYTTTATTPDADGNLFLGGYTTFENVANKIGNKNELSNSNFLTPSPEAITHPNATPESYVAGTQIFSGVYAGDNGCTVTLIDGRVNCTAGDYQFKLPNTGGLERVPVFTSSVSDYDGIPKTTGVSHALVADEYVVTVTSAAGDVFSVKLEQGSVATRHEAIDLYNVVIPAYIDGAYGGGVTDDTLNFQKTLDRSKSRFFTVIDLGGRSYLLDRISINDNTKIINGELLFIAANGYGVEDPAITGSNFVRGVNTESNYPTSIVKNVGFNNVTFRYKDSTSTVNPILIGMFNVNGLDVDNCKFENVNGVSINVIGNHVGFTPNTGHYDIPVPIGYCENISILNNQFDGVESFTSPFEYGTAVHMVACRDFTIRDNRVTNIPLGYSVDFLNYNFSVVNNKYKVTAASSAGTSVEGIMCYIGQASQIGDIHGNIGINASRICIYCEGSSSLSISLNKALVDDSFPSAATPIGIAIIPNFISSGSPILACQDVNVSWNEVLGYITGIDAGNSTMYGLSRGSICNNTIKSHVKTNAAIAVRNPDSFDLSHNKCAHKIDIFGFVDSSINSNIVKVTAGFALEVSGGEFRDVVATNNTLKTDSGSVCTSQFFTGKLEFKGGVLAKTGDIIVTFSPTYFDLSFTDYDLGFDRYFLSAYNTDLAAQSGSSHDISVLGVETGCDIEVYASTDIHQLSYKGRVPSPGVVRLNVFNNGATPISSNIDYGFFIKTRANYGNRG